MQFTYVISGPTGSGKTNLALSLKDQTSASFLNVDPFQCYKEIPIISNQLHGDLRDPLTASRSLFEPLSAGEFARQVRPLLIDGASRKQRQILVGTGLYLGALLYGLDEPGKKGTPFQGQPLISYKMLVMDPDREKLYQKINERVDQMIEQGAVEEARKVFESFSKQAPPTENERPLPSLKAIGLPQLFSFFQNEIEFERAVELWKQQTRYLAKRQWTWLRKFCAPSESIIWIKDPELESQRIRDFFEIRP